MFLRKKIPLKKKKMIMKRKLSKKKLISKFLDLVPEEGKSHLKLSMNGKKKKN